VAKLPSGLGPSFVAIQTYGDIIGFPYEIVAFMKLSLRNIRNPCPVTIHK